MNKFRNAFRGILTGIAHKSIGVQFLLAAVTLAAGMIVRLDSAEWMAVCVCIALVISTEMLNTCVEKLCDMYSTEYREDIKDIKDIAAGAVLCASMGALICALIILVRHI